MNDPNDVLRHQTPQDLEAELPEEAFRLAEEDAPAALEALLFAAGDPVPAEKLHQVTGLEMDVLQRILNEMSARYTRDRSRGLLIREIEGTWLMCTKPEEGLVLERLFQPRHRPPLSQAAYETLAIIAYNQPVTRSQVEAVRGVNSDNIISRLIERNLVVEAGTLDTPGRPTLFATSSQFLQDFGLRSVKDLPPMEMLMYGTLRDFEETLEEAAGRRRDKQLTIDQLVRDIVPGSAEESTPALQSRSASQSQPAAKASQPADTEPANAEPAFMPDGQVLQLSGAIFGEDPKEGAGADTPGQAP